MIITKRYIIRCLSCDRALSDKESTRKFQGSKTYVDLCDKCFDTIKDQKGLEVIEKEDLTNEVDYDRIATKLLDKYEKEQV